MELLKKYKYLIAAALALLVLVMFYRWAKSRGGYTPLPTDAGATGQLTQAQQETVREIALKLKQDIYGVQLNPFARFSDVYTKFLLLSDTLFVAVCNDYKLLTGTSLKDDMNSETYFATDYDKAALIIQRMNQLNIA